MMSYWILVVRGKSSHDGSQSARDYELTLGDFESYHSHTALPVS